METTRRAPTPSRPPLSPSPLHPESPWKSSWRRYDWQESSACARSRLDSCTFALVLRLSSALRTSQQSMRGARTATPHCIPSHRTCTSKPLSVGWVAQLYSRCMQCLQFDIGVELELLASEQQLRPAAPEPALRCLMNYRWVHFVLWYLLSDERLLNSAHYFSAW